MNKAETKYYSTSKFMIQALIELLNKKDFEFITVKEICKKAGVNRSTFYLHYDNMNDLLEECVEHSNKKYLEYFSTNYNDFLLKIKKAEKNELILINSIYLEPYLKYIKENRILHIVGIKHCGIMKSNDRYAKMFNQVLSPILERFNIDKSKHNYIMSYYINGVTAIVNQWIENGCTDTIEFIIEVIKECVRPYKEI